MTATPQKTELKPFVNPHLATLWDFFQQFKNARHRTFLALEKVGITSEENSGIFKKTFEELEQHSKALHAHLLFLTQQYSFLPSKPYEDFVSFEQYLAELSKHIENLENSHHEYKNRFIEVWQKIKIQHRSSNIQKHLNELKEKLCQEIKNLSFSQELLFSETPQDWISKNFNLSGDALLQRQKELEVVSPSLSRLLEECEFQWFIFEEPPPLPPPVLPDEVIAVVVPEPSLALEPSPLASSVSSVSSVSSASNTPAILESVTPPVMVESVVPPILESPKISGESENKKSLAEPAVVSMKSDKAVALKKETKIRSKEKLKSTASSEVPALPLLPSPKVFSLEDSSKEMAEALLEYPPEKRQEHLQGLIWRLIAEQKEPFAYTLTRYLEKEIPTFDLWIPSWILRALIYGQNILTIEEELLQTLQEDFEAMELFHTEEKVRQEGLELLLASAAFQAALFAPHCGSSEILKQLHLGKSFPFFWQLLTRVAGYGDLNIPLNPEVLDQAQSATLWQKELKTVLEKAQKESEQTRERSMMSTQGKKLWPCWAKKEGGLLYQILRIILKNDRCGAEELQIILLRLKTEKLIEKELKSTARIMLGFTEDYPPPEKKRMIQVTQEVLDLAKHWLKLQESNPEKTESRWVQKTEKIKETILEDYETIQKELKSQNTPRTHPLISAGIQQCLNALQTVRALFDPASQSSLADSLERKWSHEELLYGRLLQFKEITLNEEWRLEKRFSDPLPRLLVALTQEEMTPEEAFSAHLERGDHLACERLLEILKKHPSTTSLSTLQKDLQKSLEAWQELLKRKIKSLHKLLSDTLIHGLLEDQEFTSWNAKVLQIEESLVQEKRSDQVFEHLEKIRKEIEAVKEYPIEEIRQRFQKVILTPEQHKRIEKVLDSGDIHTANDYLDRIERQEPLPELAEDHPFLRFFSRRESAPHVRGKFFSITEGMDKQQIKPRKIIDTIEQRKPLFEMEFHISAIQAKENKEMLEVWFTAKRENKLSEEQARILLDHLGFNLLEMTPKIHGNQIWFHIKTEPIRERALCPVPHFGSQAKGQYSILCVWDRPNEEDLLLEVSELLSQLEGHFVFYFGRVTEKKRRDLARLARKHRRKILLLDDVLLIFLCSVRGSRLPVFFQCTLPFSFLEPYVGTGSSLPPEMFYGRKPQIDSLIDPQGSSFLYGGRQLGKTAILKYIEHAFPAQDQQKIACYLDLNSKGIGNSRSMDEIWSILAEALKEKGILELPRFKKEDSLLKHIKEWLNKDYQRRILFLIDEADIFLESDAKDRFERCEKLKGLMVETERRFKVVFAGLHNVQRTTRVSNNPLAHYGEPICIGPLLTNGEAKAAYELIEHPFNSLGYFFESPDIITRILAQTNYYPSLIQIYASHLLRYLTEKQESLFDSQKVPPYFIQSFHVDEAYKNRDLRQEIRSKLMLTLNLDKRYRVIAFIFAFHQKMNSQDHLPIDIIREEALLYWPEGFKNTTSQKDYLELLEEMLELGILRREGEAYALRSPNVVMLLGTEQEISSELSSCYQLELPPQYEPKYFRRSFDEKHLLHRSPLTVSQESELKNKKHQALILSGCSASGLEDVPKALASFFEAPFYKELKDIQNLEGFQEFLSQWGKRESDGTTLVLISENSPWDLHWIQAAQDKIKKFTSKSSFATFLFLANPQKIWDFGKDFEETKIPILTLEPWHDLALRHWLEDSGIFITKEERQKITDYTGNWPKLFSPFYESKDPSPLNHLENQLEERYGLSTLAHPEKRLELLSLFAFPPQTLPLLRLIAEYKEPLDEQTLVDLGEDALLVGQTLRWAHHLHFLTARSKTFILDPFIAKLLLSEESLHV
jgi:hypothetical protein